MDGLNKGIEPDVHPTCFWKVLFNPLTYRLFLGIKPGVLVLWGLLEDLNCRLVLLMDGSLIHKVPGTYMLLKLLILVVEGAHGVVRAHLILLGD